MNITTTLLSTLSELNYSIHELKNILALSTNKSIQYVKPLTLGTYDENGNRNIELSSYDFRPQDMPWPAGLDAVFSFKVMPDRVQNSLPRHLGHIVIPSEHKEITWELVKKINALKESFHNCSKALYQTVANTTNITYSQLLRDQEVFNNGEHYEMVIRPIITSRLAYGKANKLNSIDDMDFSSLTDEDEFRVKKLSLKWLISNYTQIHKGSFEKLRGLAELEAKVEVASEMEAYTSKNPDAIFVKRYYLPPAPIAHYQFGDKWLSNKFTVNSPILVFDEIESAEYKTKLNPVDVTVLNGTARAKKSLVGLEDKIKELVKGSNWYALL